MQVLFDGLFFLELLLLGRRGEAARKVLVLSVELLRLGGRWSGEGRSRDGGRNASGLEGLGELRRSVFAS